MRPSLIRLRLIAAGLAVCLVQIAEADAGIVVVGSPAWNRLQTISESVPASTVPPLKLVDDRPWRGAWSLGSAGASVPVVQNRRDDGPQSVGEAAPLAPAPIARRRQTHELRLPPPRPGGVYRPPKDVSASAEVTLV